MDNVIRELWEAIAGLRAKRGGANATELQSRHLSATAPTDKDLWIWNATTKKWEPSGSAQVLFCRATANLTLTTSAQSIVGDGDSTKVRLLLPTIGDWVVEAICDFTVTVVDPDRCIGELFVSDGGSAESGAVIFGDGQVNAGTVTQRWKVTVTTADTPIELKARKETDAGTAYAMATHTTLSAQIGAGGGSAAAASDHGNLDGLGDPADHNWALLVDGSRAGSTGQAQDFGSTGIKTDAIAESTGDAGVTIDSVPLKDGEVDGVDVSAHAANADAHHAKYTNAEAVAAVEAETMLEFDASTVISTASNFDLTIRASNDMHLQSGQAEGDALSMQLYDTNDALYRYMFFGFAGVSPTATLGGEGMALYLGSNLHAFGYKITGLGAGTGAGDSLRYEQRYTDADAVAAVPYSFNIAFGAEPINGQMFSP